MLRRDAAPWRCSLLEGVLDVLADLLHAGHTLVLLALGGGASRVVGALRERIPGANVNHSQGVSVEVGEKQAAVDLDIVAEYGVSIADLATGLRRNVITAIERMTGLEVTEVNVTVHDIHLAGDDDVDSDDAVTRVQ